MLVVMNPMHIILRVGKNGEAVFAGHAERREARCDGSPKIVRRRVGALDDGSVRQCFDDAAKALRKAVTRDRPSVCES